MYWRLLKHQGGTDLPVEGHVDQRGLHRTGKFDLMKVTRDPRCSHLFLMKCGCSEGSLATSSFMKLIISVQLFLGLFIWILSYFPSGFIFFYYPFSLIFLNLLLTFLSVQGFACAIFPLYFLSSPWVNIPLRIFVASTALCIPVFLLSSSRQS